MLSKEATVMMQDEVVYQFARCKQPLTMRLMWNHGLPLPESQLEVVDPALRWEQLRVGLPFVLPLDAVQIAFQHRLRPAFAKRQPHVVESETCCEKLSVCLPLLHASFPLEALSALSFPAFCQ